MITLEEFIMKEYKVTLDEALDVINYKRHESNLKYVVKEYERQIYT